MPRGILYNILVVNCEEGGNLKNCSFARFCIPAPASPFIVSNVIAMCPYQNSFQTKVRLLKESSCPKHEMHWNAERAFTAVWRVSTKCCYVHKKIQPLCFPSAAVNRIMSSSSICFVQIEHYIAAKPQFSYTTKPIRQIVKCPRRARIEKSHRIRVDVKSVAPNIKESEDYKVSVRMRQ